MASILFFYMPNQLTLIPSSPGSPDKVKTAPIKDSDVNHKLLPPENFNSGLDDFGVYKAILTITELPTSGAIYFKISVFGFLKKLDHKH